MNKGFYINGVRQFSPREAYAKCQEGFLLLDVRSLAMCRFKAFGVPELVHFPWRSMEEYYLSVPQDRDLIVADAAGVNGMDVIRFLRSKGFVRLSNLAGGLVEWERDGLPVLLNVKERLSGSCVCQLKPREGLDKK